MRLLLAGLLLSLVPVATSCAEVVPANRKQGPMHAFLVVKSTEGKILGVADEVVLTRGTLVRMRLTIRFFDGSIDDEATVFTQDKVLHLIRDHHVQKGPSFPKPLDVSIDVEKEEVVWRDMKEGKGELKTQHVDYPPDLANGIVPLVIENFPKGGTELKVSYLGATPKPRIVTLSIRPEGEDSFRIGGIRRTSTRFNIHIELGGMAGAIAPVIGKQPADVHVWVLEGEVPTVLRAEGALYEGGPVWTTEPTAPVWTKKTH